MTAKTLPRRGDGRTGREDGPARQGDAPTGRAADPGARQAPEAGDRSAGALGERILRFLAAVFTLCGAAAFPASAVFDLQSVDVRGNNVVSAAQVLRRIGVAPGDSVFHVNASEIRRRLRADPLIDDAWVSMAFPRRLTVYVRERTPVAALWMGDGYMLLSQDAVAMSRAAAPEPYLPLRIDHVPRMQPGSTVPSADVRLGAGVAGTLPAPLRPQIDGLSVDAGGEVVLQTRDGVAVLVGGPDGIADRLAQVPDVLAAVRARGLRVHYVDLRFPGSVIVKPVGASGNGTAPVSTRPPGVP